MPPNTAILLTPPSSAAIAVVRLAGPAVGGFLSRHFSRPLHPNRCVHGQLTDASRTLDDPVIVLSPDRQFADLNLHASPWIIRSLFDLASREGFHIIDEPHLPLPPESVDADSLLEQEVLSHLPLAKTELALRILLAQPAAWKTFLQQTPTPDQIQSILDDPSLLHLLHPPRVAIIGAPNVGKSTLANRLFAQERSITADLPGTTRDWVGEIANLDGLPILLLDTPGLRPTPDPIEHLAIQRSADIIRTADLILLILDPTQPLDWQLTQCGLQSWVGQTFLSAMSRHSCPLIQSPESASPSTPHPHALLVLNKSDLSPLWNTDTLPALPISATQGTNLNTLRSAIRRHFHCDALPIPHPRLWTARQRHLLLQSLHDPAFLSAL